MCQMWERKTQGSCMQYRLVVRGKKGNSESSRNQRLGFVLGKRLRSSTPMCTRPKESTPLVCFSEKSESLLVIQAQCEEIMEPIKALVDSGASANFISNTLVEKYRIAKKSLNQPREVEAIHGESLPTKIWHRIRLKIHTNGFTYSERFYVMLLRSTHDTRNAMAETRQTKN